MADRSRAIRCRAENMRAPLLVYTTIGCRFRTQGNAETLAVLGNQARRWVHLWKYMLSEVRPHELYTRNWVMMEAESLRLVGEMGPSRTLVPGPSANRFARRRLHFVRIIFVLSNESQKVYANIKADSKNESHTSSSTSQAKTILSCKSGFSSISALTIPCM